MKSYFIKICGICLKHIRDRYEEKKEREMKIITT